MDEMDEGTEFESPDEEEEGEEGAVEMIKNVTNAIPKHIQRDMCTDQPSEASSQPISTQHQQASPEQQEQPVVLQPAATHVQPAPKPSPAPDAPDKPRRRRCPRRRRKAVTAAVLGFIALIVNLISLFTTFWAVDLEGSWIATEKVFVFVVHVFLQQDVSLNFSHRHASNRFDSTCDSRATSCFFYFSGEGPLWTVAILQGRILPSI